MITFKRITTRRVGETVFDAITGTMCTITGRKRDRADIEHDPKGFLLYRVDAPLRPPGGGVWPRLAGVSEWRNTFEVGELGKDEDSKWPPEPWD